MIKTILTLVFVLAQVRSPQSPSRCAQTHSVLPILAVSDRSQLCLTRCCRVILEIPDE